MQKVILSCQDVENFMIDYVGGELSFMSKLQFKLHISICPDCDKYLQTYQHAIRMGKRIFEKPDDEAIDHVPEEIVNAILKATAKK